MRPVDFRLLLVTDRHQTRGRSLPTVVEAAILGGVSAVHLRERDLSTRDLLTLAQEVRAVTRPGGVRLIMNDRIDVVLALDLDGVHLRADSISATVARRLLGPDRLIGISTHSIADVRQANEDGADYIVFGPIFETPSKRMFGPPLGLDALSAACAASHVPVLAIGGITHTRVTDVLRSGAAGVAVIGAILNHIDVAAAAHDLCAAMEQ